MKDSQKTKKSILERVLKDAAFDGWNEDALEKSAEKCGFAAGFVHTIFPSGIRDLVDFLHQENNANMEKQIAGCNLQDMRIREKIAKITMTRILLYKNNREAIRKLLSYYSLPQNSAQSIRHLSDIVDKIWYLAGDNASDWNYYSKRMLLTGVYTSTLLYFLNDDSKNFKDTEKFLHRRIENVMQIQKLRGTITKNLEKFREFSSIRKIFS